MRTISVKLSDADYATLKLLAVQDERPVAELIREAMNRWLVDHRRNGGSLADIRPVDCGAVVRPFDRSEVGDEMFER